MLYLAKTVRYILSRGAVAADAEAYAIRLCQQLMFTTVCGILVPESGMTDTKEAYCMKPRKILTVLTIALLTILLCGCGQTLEEKIEEVQAKNTVTTADVVELLELEGMEVKPQKPGYAINENWKNVVIYKVEGENLLIMTQFGGTPWERNKKLQELELNDRWAWFGLGYAEKSPAESIKHVVEQLKPDVGYYSSSRVFNYKNIIAVYVPYMPIDSVENMTEEERIAIYKQLEVIQEITNRVCRVFWQDLCGMTIEEHTTAGKYMDVTLKVHFYGSPYEHKERVMYEFFEKSDVLIELHEDVAKQYSEKEIKIECRGPLDGPIANGGSRGLTVGAIYSTRSYMLNASRENVGYGKEPYTGPIQYEVTVTIGDDITETLIVGREGAEAAE